MIQTPQPGFCPLLLALAALTGSAAVSAQSASAGEAPVATGGGEALSDLDAELERGAIRRRHLGIEWSSASKRFLVHPWLRVQTRFSDPFDSDPRTPAAFADPPGADLEVRRARLKMDVQLGSPSLTLYFEHELSGDAPLLDLRVDVDFGNDLYLRAGQYKVLYNRERVDSSGKQVFVERSISTYAFTLDRQRGAMLGKHFAAGTAAEQWLMLGIFEGDSRAPGPRGDEPMLVARWQWNFLGDDVPFRQGDLALLDKPVASLAFGAATVRGPYTRFSSSGGGQLDGFAAGSDERYELTQWLQEFAWRFDGWSVQQEFHSKRIRDHETGSRSSLSGGYAQIAKAWQPWTQHRQRIVQVAARYAEVDWKNTPADRLQREFTLASNLYLDGHDNKLTVDVSRLELDYHGSPDSSDTRWRLQWDVSF